MVGAFAVLMPGATAPVRLGLALAAMLVFATAAQGVRWLERARAKATETSPSEDSDTG